MGKSSKWKSFTDLDMHNPPWPLIPVKYGTSCQVFESRCRPAARRCCRQLQDFRPHDEADGRPLHIPERPGKKSGERQETSTEVLPGEAQKQDEVLSLKPAPGFVTQHDILFYITLLHIPHMYSELHVSQETDGESLTPRSSAAYSSNHNTQSISQGQNFRHIKTRDRHDYMILKTMNVCFKMMPPMMLNPKTLAP